METQRKNRNWRTWIGLATALLLMDIAEARPRKFLKINPQSVSMAAGSQTTFTANGGVAPYTFQVSSGSISVNSSSSIVYVAPNAAGSATVTVRDSNSNVATAQIQITLTSTPTPTPTPTPMPTPVPPTSTGLPPIIPSNFDTSKWIYGTAGVDVPPSAYPDNVGAFRFVCKPSHNLYDDPIVFPGKPGASHLHTFFGNTLANAHSTYESLRSSGDGTCDGGPLNRTAYWMPSMFNGQGKVVMPDIYVIYYKAKPGTHRIPRGLRFVFGYNFSNGAPFAGQFYCGDGTNGGGKTIAGANCPPGVQLIADISAPQCWNGQLDSPDHRSHLAWHVWDQGASGTPWPGPCPTTHPIELPQISLKAFFTHDNDLAQWKLSSDHMAGDVPGGTTLHADWFGAWDDMVLETFQANAIDKLLNCSGGQLGDGRVLVRPPSFTWYANPRLVDAPPPPMGHNHLHMHHGHGHIHGHMNHGAAPLKQIAAQAIRKPAAVSEPVKAAPKAEPFTAQMLLCKKGTEAQKFNELLSGGSRKIPMSLDLKTKH